MSADAVKMPHEAFLILCQMLGPPTGDDGLAAMWDRYGEGGELLQVMAPRYAAPQALFLVLHRERFGAPLAQGSLLIEEGGAEWRHVVITFAFAAVAFGGYVPTTETEND